MTKVIRVAFIALGIFALQASNGAYAQSKSSSSSSSSSGATGSQAIPSAPSAPSTQGGPPSTAPKPTDPCPSGQMLSGTPPKCVAVSGVKK
jgi:hypothetical protein